MEFENDKAIYIQIAEFVQEKILKDEWKSDEKILSVRDLAGEIEVNPNTVMRSYELLQQMEIIYNKRGLGFFVSPDAKEIILKVRKQYFMEVELPRFFYQMGVLGISLEEFTQLYKEKK